MRWVDLEMSSVAANLALDEAFLDSLDHYGETVRTWEVATPTVVIGRSSRIDEEVDRNYCEQHNIPVVRRCSGGAAVVILPGCLLYSVVLSFEQRPEVQSVDHAHRLVLGKTAEAIQRCGVSVELLGTSDLTLDRKKFSGNSLRSRRDGLLYHGTLLYAASLDTIAACLRTPPRQPDYRAQRSHKDFLMNLPIAGPRLRTALRDVWTSERDQLFEWPQQRHEQLLSERYLQPSWNQQR